jgi:hypothetical protein
VRSSVFHKPLLRLARIPGAGLSSVSSFGMTRHKEHSLAEQIFQRKRQNPMERPNAAV